MHDGLNLRPWVVPRWAIEPFCAQIRAYDDFGFYVHEVKEHNPENYLVITNGRLTEAEEYLENYASKIWSMSIDELHNQVSMAQINLAAQSMNNGEV